jgi:hypothetical protein
MKRVKWMLGLGLAVMMMMLLLLLVACEGYSATGKQSSSYENMNGGGVKVSVKKANGTITERIETTGTADLVLDAVVTLSVGKGSYKIELLGEGDEVTLSLEAGDGQAVSGQGWMATDGFGEARYRLTAVEAEDVEYTIDYTFR